MPYFMSGGSNGKFYLVKGGNTFDEMGEMFEVSKEEAMKYCESGISNEIA